MRFRIDEDICRELFNNSEDKDNYELVKIEKIYEFKRSKSDHRWFLFIHCKKCGNDFKSEYYNWKTGKRCKVCAGKNVHKDKVYNLEKAMVTFENHGYKYLEGDYKNNRDKITVEDDMGYKYFQNISNLLKRENVRFEIFHPNNPYTIFNIQRYIFLNNISTKLITEHYISNNENMIWECGKCKKHFERKLIHFKDADAHYCKKCSSKSTHDEQRFSLEDVKKEFVLKGLIPLFDNYYKNNGYLKCMTKEGYLLKTTLNNVKVCKNSPDIFNTSNPYSIHNIKLYLSNNEISTKLLSTNYLGNDKKLTWACGKCGEEFERDLAHFKDRPSYYCVQCSRDIAMDKQRLDFQHVVDIVTNHNYKPLFTEYINFKQKLDVEDELGYKYTPMLATFNNNNNPCRFEKSNKYSFYNLKHHIKLNNIDVELLFDGFLNNSTLLPFKCSCGDMYYATVASFIHNNQHRCSKCSKSKSYLALMTEKWMDTNDIKYVNEYWYEDCKAIYPLRFDYYLPDYDILIEVDGKHHFEPVPMGSMTWSEAVDEFNKRLEYDDIKTNYAKTNSIKLIRLPYWEFNDDYYMKILSNEILKTENVIVDKIS